MQLRPLFCTVSGVFAVWSAWRRLAVLGAGYAAGLVVLRVAPVTGPLVSVAAVGFGVTAAALAARSAPVARVLGGSAGGPCRSPCCTCRSWRSGTRC